MLGSRILLLYLARFSWFFREYLESFRCPLFFCFQNSILRLLIEPFLSRINVFRSLTIDHFTACKHRTPRGPDEVIVLIRVEPSLLNGLSRSKI